MQVYPVFLPLAGCPHRCRFCRQEGVLQGGGIPGPDEAALSLEAMLPAAGTGEIAFYGGTFTLLPEAEQDAYLKIANRFVRRGQVSGIRISTRPDALPGPVIDRLSARGVSTVEIGCQSFSAAVLELSGRGHGPEAAGGAVARLRAAGLQVGLQLMPGLPGGSCSEAVSSLREALALCPDFLRIYPAAVFRGTALENDWRSGSYRPLGLAEAVDICAELLWRCRRAGVPVIRLGLMGTPSLAAELLAGPWHPAFGQLVRSHLWLRALEAGAKLTGIFGAGVHPSDLPDALGHRRENLNELRRRFGDFVLDADPDLQRGECRFGLDRIPRDHLNAYEE